VYLLKNRTPKNLQLEDLTFSEIVLIVGIEGKKSITQGCKNETQDIVDRLLLHGVQRGWDFV